MYISLQGRKLSLRERRRQDDWKPPLLYDKRQSPTAPSSSLPVCKQPIAFMHFRHFLTNCNVGYNARCLVNLPPATSCFQLPVILDYPMNTAGQIFVLCATGFQLLLTHVEDIPYYLFKISERKCRFFPRDVVAFLFSITIHRSYNFIWGSHTIWYRKVIHSTRLEQNLTRITSRCFDVNNMVCCSYNFILFYQITLHVYSLTFCIMMDYLLFIFDESVF